MKALKGSTNLIFPSFWAFISRLFTGKFSGQRDAIRRELKSASREKGSKGGGEKINLKLSLASSQPASVNEK